MTVILPLASVPVKNQNSNDSNGVNQALTKAGVSILLVDDNEVNLRITKQLLKKKGMLNVVCAKSGEESIRICQARDENPLEPPIEIIFMDLMMTGMSGFDAAKQIFNMRLKNRPKIIALTGNAMFQNKLQAFQIGMSGFLAKPTTVDELLKQIKLNC